MNSRLIGTAAVAVSMALAGCASSPGYSNYGRYDGYGNGYGGGYRGECYDCGTVTRIEVVGGERGPNVAGPLIGGIVGAVAAKELARHNTDSHGRRNVAIGAGAVGGAVAGNAIQNRAEGARHFNVHVRMQDGRTVVLSQGDLDGIREGSPVRVQNGRAYAY
ncbi:peptidoglycan-associated outer membrane lipoprotein precursor [Luteimonas sp. S4-F44]|uniref:peptidoglycan-associated outer membrane lipoprotein precursor n=1 Tax=Luteimonas sp. S4-F44 TaxID=2925842 RepID=UPI001F53C4E3|nr:peptidoglycan-associated outer membrane lipoprotein precursor [Luteimonas sp. S4-F44]UNK41128.1 peptidoglycan-associated outer membrane lipoprotein precursor [Luteimonas sp. S4-F44]